MAKSVDLVQDDVGGRGPDKGLAVRVVIHQVALDRRLKGRDAVERAAADSPDGRIPPYTPEAEKRRAAILEFENALLQATEICKNSLVGCSGWKYIVDYGDKIAPDDQLFEVAGLSIVIDPKSLPLLAGSRIDLVMDGLKEKFVFDNPNAASSCGCGESFTV